jgi:hypothetical protein
MSLEGCYELEATLADASEVGREGSSELMFLFEELNDSHVSSIRLKDLIGFRVCSSSSRSLIGGRHLTVRLILKENRKLGSRR